MRCQFLGVCSERGREHGGGCLRPIAIGAALLLAVLLVVGWKLFGIATLGRTYHYRLTLYVETPEGAKQESSVVEVTTKFPGGLPPAESRAKFVTGEATMVDLGSRGLLFALLVGDERRRAFYGFAGAAYIVEAAFSPGSFWPGNPDPPRSAYIDELNRRKATVDLPLAKLPLLIRFDDPSDRNSIKYVDPVDLAASFGPGVRLARATISITDNPGTTEIKEKLPWLKTSDFGDVVYTRPHKAISQLTFRNGKALSPTTSEV